MESARWNFSYSSSLQLLTADRDACWLTMASVFCVCKHIQQPEETGSLPGCDELRGVVVWRPTSTLKRVSSRAEILPPICNTNRGNIRNSGCEAGRGGKGEGRGLNFFLLQFSVPLGVWGATVHEYLKVAHFWHRPFTIIKMESWHIKHKARVEPLLWNLMWNLTPPQKKENLAFFYSQDPK